MANDDLRAIHQVIEDAQTFQNDLEGFTQLLTHDAVIVNVAGRRVRGRDQIYTAMKQALETPLANVLTTTEVEDIRFLRPDAALASCTKYISDQRDERTAAVPEKGSLTFVLVKEQDRWLITSAQTTPIKS
jgi:uncharacterized protein (TIGR02246 family)